MVLLAHEPAAVAPTREPVEGDVERAPADPQTELAPSADSVDHDFREVERYVDDGIGLDGVELDGVEPDDVELEQQNDAAPTREPVAAVDPERAGVEAVQLETGPPAVEEPAVEEPAVEEPAVEQLAVEQLALLEVEPDLADEVGAHLLRMPDADPVATQARDAAAAAERDRQEQARVTLAEARRQAEAADAQRQAREAAADPTAALEQAMQDLRAAVAAMDAAERTRAEDAERQEQLIRWHEQDRAAELDRGLDDGPSLGRD